MTTRMTLRLDESVRRYVDQAAAAEGVAAATWAADVVRRAAMSAATQAAPDTPDVEIQEWRQLVRSKRAAQLARFEDEGLTTC